MSAEESSDATGLSTAQMKWVLEVSRLFAVTTDLDSLLRKIAHAACDLVQCERASIWLHDPKRKELYTTVILDQKKILSVPANTGIVGACFNSNTPQNVPDAYADSRFNRSADLTTGFKTRSLLAVPMVDIEGKPVGVIQAVNKKTGVFGSQDEALVQLLADQAGVAIQRSHLQLRAIEAARMAQEMETAQGIQKQLLPDKPPVFANFDLFGIAIPASQTGGDCYDLWIMPDGRLGILLCDAVGHGVGAALLVSQARALVRMLCDGASPIPTPHDVLMRVHRRMCNDLHPSKFVTAFLGYMHPDGTLEWQSAGHAPILARTDGNHALESLEAVLAPINCMEDPSEATPPPIQLRVGGMLAVLSDGISEAFDPSEQLYEAHRIAAELTNSQNMSARDATEAPLTSVGNWQQHNHPLDDQTIVLLKKTG